MNQDYKKLADGLENQCQIQTILIENQKKQILNLERMNEMLNRQYQELQVQYDDVVAMCHEQQEWLDRVLGPDHP